MQNLEKFWLYCTDLHLQLTLSMQLVNVNRLRHWGIDVQAAMTRVGADEQCCRRSG